MKIKDVIENIKKYHKGYGTIDETKTRDQILYGKESIEDECRCIVTTCWASLEVIRKAIEFNANLIICHEALFYNHGDHTKWLFDSNNSTFKAKEKLLKENNIVVWRDHDYIHSGIPYRNEYIDGIFLGLAHKMGWEDRIVPTNIGCLDNTINPGTAYKFDKSISAQDLSYELIDKLNLNGIKMIGNYNTDVKKAAVLFHVFGDANEAIMNADKSDVDCLLTMELVDFTMMEYIRDSAMLNRNLVALNMGHFNLEEPGMEYILTYLDEAIGEHIEAHFVQSGDNYKYIIRH